MPRRLSTALAVLTIAGSGMLGAASPAVAAAPVEPPPAAEAPVAAAPAPVEGTVREKADEIMNLTYRQFAQTPHIAPYNWTNDGCSVPTGFEPYSKVFRPACELHDFGYRNYGGNWELKLSPTRETKQWIDGRFRTEMRRVCDDTYRNPLSRQGCLRAADAYYGAVSLGGDKAFF
ncbi:phospholipase A2 [Streptomyces sp. HNM0574]|uniref:phospholipase A2 n=1 Tax=Streptomyces sp. HNM0574 TaxID=2714954 RepID=UPI00146B237D|nr:phospholipase A2 [Streptomyces sp. HNM0574]NLU70733.1 hypothetical protein [Streptomyces sp. HNM0574]